MHPGGSAPRIVVRGSSRATSAGICGTSSISAASGSVSPMVTPATCTGGAPTVQCTLTSAPSSSRSSTVTSSTDSVALAPGTSAASSRCSGRMPSTTVRPR